MGAGNPVKRLVGKAPFSQGGPFTQDDPLGVANGLGLIRNAFGRPGKAHGDQSQYKNSMLTALNAKDPNARLDTNGNLIDDQTQADIRKILNSGWLTADDQAGLNALYNGAKEGMDIKFKERMATQKLYETLVDQPGQQQTRNASLLDAYKGRG